MLFKNLLLLNQDQTNFGGKNPGIPSVFTNAEVSKFKDFQHLHLKLSCSTESEDSADTAAEPKAF